jgi:hypothetical protein
VRQLVPVRERPCFPLELSERRSSVRDHMEDAVRVRVQILVGDPWCTLGRLDGRLAVLEVGAWPGRSRMTDVLGDAPTPQVSLLPRNREGRWSRGQRRAYGSATGLTSALEIVVVGDGARNYTMSVAISGALS